MKHTPPSETNRGRHICKEGHNEGSEKIVTDADIVHRGRVHIPYDYAHAKV